MNIRQIITAILVGIALFLLVVYVPRAIAVRSDNYRWFDPIVDIREIIVSEYVQHPDQDMMQQAVIEGMIESLDDPFCQYIRPEDQMKFRKDLSGNYVGIGARIHSNKEWLTIITPMENSPALKAGILAGDQILAINGISTQDQSVEESIDKLLGEPGTSVEVHVRHTDGSEETLDIIREPIETRSTFGLIRRNNEWIFLLDDERNIAFIGLEQFTNRTAEELQNILSELQKNENLEGLILDVRSNPGGALTAALEIADLFVDDGTLLSIRSARSDRRSEERIFKAHAPGTFTDVPIIILIDDRSASASEIIAGSLKDNDRAKILGERSYGKGSVQEVRELDDHGGILKFTTAYYYLPSGRSLHRMPGHGQEEWGVDPSEGYILTETVEDYNQRYESRLPWTIITRDEPDDPQTGDPTWLRETMDDAMLARAVELMNERLDAGEWPALEAQDDPAELALRDELELAIRARTMLMERMHELDTEIATMEGRTQLVDHGVDLPEELDLEHASLVIRDPDGNPLGVWRVEKFEELRRALTSVKLTPTTTESPGD